MRVIGIDPGITVGYATLDDTVLSLSDTGQIHWEQLTGRLDELLPIDEVIFEGYRVLPRYLKAHSGSRLETVQCIGKIKEWCERNGIHYVQQPPSILPIAQRWTQVYLPSNHGVSHQVSAFLHAAYWLIQNNYMETALVRQARERKET